MTRGDMSLSPRAPGRPSTGLPCVVLLGAAVASLVSTGVLGEGGGHSAHVHGVAELTLAMEGRDVEIALTLPADSVLGFESKAASPAQLEAVAKAEATLNDVTGLFSFSGTRCEPQETEIDMSAVLNEEHEGHQDHEKHADHDEHADHGDRKGHEHHEGETHTDVAAHYKFVCADGERLESVRVGSDGLPYGLDKINVMWITDRAQGGATLTPEHTYFELR